MPPSLSDRIIKLLTKSRDFKWERKPFRKQKQENKALTKKSCHWNYSWTLWPIISCESTAHFWSINSHFLQSIETIDSITHVDRAFLWNLDVFVFPVTYKINVTRAS